MIYVANKIFPLKIFLFINLFVGAFLFSTFALASGSYNAGVMVQKRNAITTAILGRASAFPGGFSTGTDPAPGIGDGMFMSPISSATDATYLYVLDSNLSRVSRFLLSTGAFSGWIGAIATVPTGGGTGCTTAAVGAFTPGWCTGGTSAAGYGDGMLANPSTMTIDSSSTNLYVATKSKLGGSKINKYTLSSGAFVGWLGSVGITPTGGVAGCTTAAVGTGAPGWCTGGDGGNELAVGSGTYYSITGLAADATNLYLADANASSISKVTTATGAYIGWVGYIYESPTGGAAGCAGAAVGTITPGWCTGGYSTYDNTTNGIGGMYQPVGLGLDGAGNVYYADVGSHMVGRFLTATGVFNGWIGYIASSPTGGTGTCAGAASATNTPGWCIGGSATISSNASKNAFWFPHDITIQSGVLYVADSAFMKKFTLSSGAYLGWRGIVQSVPTGGATGCTTAAVGTATPGWCTGGVLAQSTTTSYAKTADGVIALPQAISGDSSGNLYVPDTQLARVVKLTASTGAFVSNLSSKSTTTVTSWNVLNPAVTGTGDGLLGRPRGIVNDGVYLYVADYNNSRILRYTLSTGAFAGWIGNIATVPTGGSVAGCTSAGIGTFTPGWCTGGTSKSGTINGALNYPNGISIDAGGSLYVADTVNNRISKYTASSGAFVGWIGKILTSPTGGATGCNGKAAGTATPGWCTGGTSDTANGTGDGMLGLVNGGFTGVDTNDNLYVTDYQNNRVVKYTASTGAYVGWMGNIATSPTGGAAGCSGKAVGTSTPGWCTGGLSTTAGSFIDGSFSQLGGVVVNGTNLYVADARRLQRFTLAGAFTGWYGTIGTTPTGGDTGCSTAAGGAEAPGWCTGGAVDTLSLSFMNLQNFIIDGNGYFYFANTIGSSIFRKSFTRAGSGYFGMVGASPTGGGANCNGLAVGKITPSWCTGGGMQYSSIIGGFQTLFGITLDAAKGYLYVSDTLQITRIPINP